MKPVLTAAALAALLAAPLTPAAAQSFPPQHWASAGGVLDVQPNGQNAWTADQVAAIQAIEEVFYRWAIFYDEGRQDLLPSILTEDVVVTVLLGGTEPIGTFTGIEAVAEYNNSSLTGQLDQRRHMMTNVLVDSLTDTTATATAFGLIVAAKDGLSLGALVVYPAELTRGDDGVWRFSRLTIAIDDYAGNLAPAE